MNINKFILASIAVFVTFQILDAAIHIGILGDVYEELKEVWRPEADMMNKMWIMYVSSFVMSFLFVYIFTRGYEGKGIAEGIRYGLLIGLLMNVVGILNQYVVYPIPYTLAAQWLIYGLIEFTICGLVVSLIYKPAKVS